MSDTPTIQSLQDEYDRVAKVIRGLRRDGMPNGLIIELLKYQASICGKMAELQG